MRKVVVGVLAAWSGIVALAWWLADRRLAACHTWTEGCNQFSLTATRDNVLIWGAATPLGLFVLIVLLGLLRLGAVSERLPLSSDPLIAAGDTHRKA